MNASRQYAAVQPDESRVVYDGKLIDVVIERWGDNEREIVEHPGAVAIVAVDQEDGVTFVRQLREPAHARLLELPAGTLDPGESPEECAQRELREETGLNGGTWSQLARFWTTPGFCRELMHVFVAEGVVAGEAAPAQDEELELVRIPVGEVDARLDELEDAKTLAGVLLWLRKRAARG